MSPLPRSHHVALVAMFVAALAGCQSPDEQLAVASVQSALQTSRSANLGKTTYELPDETACLDPEDAAEEAATSPSVGLYPEGCVDKRADGTSLHVAYDGCTGPFGRVLLKGGVDAKFSAASCDVIHAEIADAGDLTANDLLIDYSASADVTVDGALRNVDWAGHWSTTTKRGWEVEQSSDLDVVVDRSTDCIKLAGKTTGHVDRWNIDADIADLEVCPGACPASGTVDVAIDGPHSDRSLAIAFDGSNVAKATTTDGDVFEVEMVCDDDD